MSGDENIVELHRRYVMPTYSPDLVLVRGKGVRVWDQEGREYLDFLAGIGVLNVGHCHPRVVAAVGNQAAKLMHVSNLYYNENQPRLARELVERSLGGKCFFCNSGAEANEALIKLARLWGKDRGGRYRIVTMRNSFHGRTLATLTATGQEKVQKGFEPLPDGFTYADFNDLESVRSAIDDRTAAVLVESVQGEGGVVPATPEFMAGLRRVCDQEGVLLFCDEVQSGMGRTGKWFGYQHYDCIPDAIALAKALGGGFPMGAIVTSSALADVFQPGNHASTFGGTPLACAAGLAVIGVIEDEGLLDNARRMGTKFRAGLEEIASRHEFVTGIRGLGLMLAMVFDRPAKDVEIIMRRKGLLALATGKTALRFLPPLVVDEDDVARALEIIADSCREFAQIEKRVS